MSYDESKLAELLLYVAEKVEQDESAGSTKLNKVLYFSELGHLRKTGYPITGAEYQKLAQGPTLRRMLPVIDRLVAAGDARMVEREYFGNIQKRLVALRRADLGKFSAEEIALVDTVIRQLWGKSAKEVSDLSHEDLGWRAAEEGDTIPLEMAFISTEGEVTDEMRELARQIASEHV